MENKRINYQVGGTTLAGSLNIITTSSPNTNIKTYFASEEGTYANFGGVTVTAGDLAAGLVQIRDIGGGYLKTIVPIDLVPYLRKSEIALENTNFYRNTDDEIGKYINGGNVGSFSNCRLSGYVDVGALIGLDLTLSGRPSQVNPSPNIAMFDAARVYLGDITAKEYATVFKITNPLCRYIRFNTVWTDGVSGSINLECFVNKEKALMDTYKGFNKIALAGLSGINAVDRRALVEDISNVTYIDFVASDTEVEIIIVDYVTKAVETIKLKCALGYNRISPALISTSSTKYWIGFSKGIYYDNVSYTSPAYTISGGVASNSNIAFAYSLGLKTKFASTKLIIDLYGEDLLTGNYDLDETITIPDNKKVSGVRATINFLTGGKILMGENTTLKGITVIGTNTAHNYYTSPTVVKADLTNFIALTDYTNAIIDTNSKKGTMILNCVFKNIDKSVIICNGGNYANGNQPIVSGNYFENCKVAISSSAEYHSIENNKIFNCEWAGVIASGNVHMQNNIVYNGCVGWVFDDNISGNGTHGSTSGGCGNHMSLCAFYFKAMFNGHVLSGISLFEGNIIAASASGLVLAGCHLDNVIDIANGSTNLITGTMFGSGYQPGGVRFIDPNSTLSLKNNLIKAAGSHTAVNN